MVGPPGQQTEKHLLRDAIVRASWDAARKLVRLEDRHLVFGHNDVRDDGGVEPLQNIGVKIADKDNKIIDFDSFLRLCFKVGARLPRQVPAEEPQRPSNHQVVAVPLIFY